jgi:hypothetical protein
MGSIMAARTHERLAGKLEPHASRVRGFEYRGFDRAAALGLVQAGAF